jgi:hypothetical protein
MHSCSLLSKNHLFNIEIHPKNAYYLGMVNGVKWLIIGNKFIMLSIKKGQFWQE